MFLGQGYGENNMGNVGHVASKIYADQSRSVKIIFLKLIQNVAKYISLMSIGINIDLHCSAQIINPKCPGNIRHVDAHDMKSNE